MLRSSRSRRNLTLRSLAVVVVLLASACGGGSTKEASRLLEPSAFANAVAEPERVTINVHVPFEGSIEGTDLSIPYDRIARDSDQLPADRGAQLAIYCKSGRMSAIAVTELERLGYRDVVELRGGMDAWTEQGLTLDMTDPADSR